MIGILATDDGFELLCGAAPIGDRRHLDTAAVAVLEGFGRRYYELLPSPYAAVGLLALGRELYGWLNGDGGHLNTLLQRAVPPLRFEIVAANRFPSAAEWALLRAPWELLADQQGFLARDPGLGFSPVRRLGRPEKGTPPGSKRLGVVFMAASPQGAAELDYEAEESAIMSAVGATKLDLLVEEGGNPEELGDRLTEYDAMQVLHLSCHGHNAWRPSGKPTDKPTPVLLLEDLEGGELPTGAGALIGALRAYRPPLVFLSACLTAAAGGTKVGGLAGDKEAPTTVRSGVAHSLSEALVDAGLPAVLGWDGSVADIAATAFAAKLYDLLGSRQDVADAVAAARRDLLGAEGNTTAAEAQRRDWHLSRLWLGPRGGGPIVGGALRRPMMPATHGQKEFLDKKSQVPVASHEMFVGRRRELQKALRVLREGEYAGVLLHGMGRLGKSSLAARIANRRRDLRLAVVYQYYGALDVLGALAEALKDSPKAREALRAGTTVVRQDSDRLEDVLTDLLSGPCGQVEADGTPVLLVIDDLEQILAADPNGGRHRVAAHAPVLRAVLRAFDAALAAGNSRVVVTSRFPFVLEGIEGRLFELPLPPLSDAAQRKLALRQKAAATDAGLAGLALAEREALLQRVPGIARGNPGLQDLVGRKLILSAAVGLERARQALDEMEAWLAQGDLPSDAEVRAFLENLAIGTLFELAGPAGEALLQGLTLFDLPVPEPVARKLEGQRGGSVRRLRELGLLDVFPDRIDPQEAAVAVNALAAGRLEPLTDGERTTLAAAVAQDLFVAWGGAAGESKRPAVCDLQLAQLGLMAGDGEIVAACAGFAVAVLNEGPAAAAADFGQAAVRLLDARQVPAPWRLLSETAQAASTSGDGTAADTLLERGYAALEAQRASGAPVDPTAAMVIYYNIAGRRATRGRLDEAQRLFEETARFAAQAGHELSATVARGAIADILQSRGDLDEALRIRTEEEIPVYERLGDVRSRAVTMGNIADILQSRGDLDEALRIRKEELLPTFERLGDVRARAVTMGKIADILQSRGDLDEALRIRKEELLPTFERLGDVRARAVTIGKIADILQSRGDLDEALRIRNEEEIPVYERLGDVRERAVTMGKIADILQSRGDLDEALRIREEEEIPVYERLGDVRARAVTMGNIADILQSRGDLDEALRIRKEELLPTFERLGEVRSRAVTMGKIADILQSRGDLDEALRIRKEEEIPVYERLGDVRARAVTMGNIAGILAQKGDLKAARALQEERLEVNRRLGDADGIGATLWGLAQLDLAEEKIGAAFPRIVEAYQIMSRLGRAEGIAVIGTLLGQILAANDRREEALTVLRRSAEMYRKLGRETTPRRPKTLSDR